MYKVLCDNALLCDSRSEELALINPVVTLEENKAGSFSFKIPPKHPFYNFIHKRKTIIDVYKDDELIFSGMCIKVSDDFYKQRSITCEGELSYLNDSIQRPAKYQNMTVRGLLEAYIANHNAQVEESKHFTVGQVTVADPNDSIYCYSNMENTLQCLKDDLMDDLGGFFRIRHENGIRYIDYLADSPNTNSQIIKIGKNLLDFTTNIDSTQIATAIIPLGAKLEESAVPGLETRLTIESVNNGLDYVHSEEAVENYGWIYKKIEFDNVTTPDRLKSKGLQYLAETQFENMVIEAKAIDLNMADSDIERFKMHDSIRIVSAPHGLDKFFRLTKQKINLNNPDKDEIRLGKTEQVSLSAKSAQVNDVIKKAVESIVPASTILNQAVANATALITSAMGGYVYKTNNELYIMDTDNPETAQKVWRWNINGLGYSSTGINGEYGLAMTMDGAIVADRITTGIFKVGENFYANCNTGEVRISADTMQAFEKKTCLYAKNFDSSRVWFDASVYAEGAEITLVNPVTFEIGALIDGKEVPLGTDLDITITTENAKGVWDAQNRTYTVNKTYRKNNEEKYVRFTLNIDGKQHTLDCFLWVISGLQNQRVYTYYIEPQNEAKTLVYDTRSGAYNSAEFSFKLNEKGSNGYNGYPSVKWKVYGIIADNAKVELKNGTSNIVSVNSAEITDLYREISIEYTTTPNTYYLAYGTVKIPIIKLLDTNTQEGIFDALTNGGQAQGLYLHDGQLYMLFNYAKGGTLSLGGVNNVNGKMVVTDANNNVLGEWTNKGINLTRYGSIVSEGNDLDKTKIGSGLIECFTKSPTSGEQVLASNISNNGLMVKSYNNQNEYGTFNSSSIIFHDGDGKTGLYLSDSNAYIGRRLYVKTADGNYFEGGELEWVYDSNIHRNVLCVNSMTMIPRT